MIPTLRKKRQISIAKEQLFQGRQVKIIGKEVGCSVQSLNRWLREDIRKYGGLRRIRNEHHRKVVNLGRKLGLTFKDIGLHEGVKESTVQHWQRIQPADIPVVVVLKVALLDSIRNIVGDIVPAGFYELEEKGACRCVLSGPSGVYEVETDNLCGHVEVVVDGISNED